MIFELSSPVQYYTYREYVVHKCRELLRQCDKISWPRYSYMEVSSDFVQLTNLFEAQFLTLTYLVGNDKLMFTMMFAKVIIIVQMSSSIL